MSFAKIKVFVEVDLPVKDLGIYDARQYTSAREAGDSGAVYVIDDEASSASHQRDLLEAARTGALCIDGNSDIKYACTAGDVWHDLESYNDLVDK